MNMYSYMDYLLSFFNKINDKRENDKKNSLFPTHLTAIFKE